MALFLNQPSQAMVSLWKFILSFFKLKEENKKINELPVIIATPPVITVTDKPFVNFPDISHYEPCDFTKFKGNDMITKATEGGSFTDNTLRYNINKCRESGIRLGVFHFYKCSIDPIVQAKYFIETVGLETLKNLYHPPVLDYETTKSQTEQDLKRNIENMKKFMAYIEKETGRIPVFYSYHSLINFLSLDHLCARWPLWIAKYGKEPAGFSPWIKYWVWQYSDGEINSPAFTDNFEGIGRCDSNKFME